jgi:hypothetical protein
VLWLGRGVGSFLNAYRSQKTVEKYFLAYFIVLMWFFSTPPKARQGER